MENGQERVGGEGLRENVREDPGKLRERFRKGLIKGFEKNPICKMLRKS